MPDTLWQTTPSQASMAIGCWSSCSCLNTEKKTEEQTDTALPSLPCTHPWWFLHSGMPWAVLSCFSQPYTQHLLLQKNHITLVWYPYVSRQKISNWPGITRTEAFFQSLKTVVLSWYGDITLCYCGEGWVPPMAPTLLCWQRGGSLRWGMMSHQANPLMFLQFSPQTTLY